MLNSGIKQRTDEWYNTRSKMITASDVAAILGYNKYKSKYDVLENKLNPKEFTSAAIQLGIKYEPLAVKEYEKIISDKVFETGLYKHKKYEWLGASPDGYIQKLDRLLEIKCVSSRSIHTFPYMYWIQMQIQMEVCDKDECDFFQCKFKEDKLVEYSLQLVKRDKEWFNNIFPKLEIFNKDMIFSMNKGFIQRKRPRFNSYIDWKDYIDIKMIENYINNDPLLDYLEMYVDKSLKDKQSDFNIYIKQKLNNFKKYIFNKSSLSVDVCTNEKYKSFDLFEKTKEHMKNGVPVIIRPLLIFENRYSIPDMIVRNDHLDKLFDCKTEHVKDKNYSIINIKFKTLHLDEEYIVKKASQKLVYTSYLQNQILNKIQGTVQEKVYIIGRRYFKDNIYFKKGLIGEIDFINYSLFDKAENAIKWIEELKKFGEYWDEKNPSRWEMYPNMCNKKDYEWKSYKKELAILNKELTLIWNIGIKKRKELHKNEIFKWDRIPKEEVTEHINKIIRINKIRGKNIRNIPKNKRFTDEMKFYVDFETVNDLSVPGDSNYNNSIIYIIGCGYKCDISDDWEFKTFKVNSFDTGEEKRIIKEWYKFMNSFEKHYEVIHWTPAEVISLRKAMERGKIRNININFVDLYKYFKDNQIVVKGAFNYGLKSIANALFKHKLIETNWIGDMDGLHASLYGWLELTEGDTSKISETIYYNEVDCKVLYEIFNLLTQ